MKSGMSRLFELQPDPYDVSQRRWIRFCLFQNVKNAVELRDMLRAGKVDAAMIKAELILEPFVLLAAANRAVHQAAHNRMSTRSLSAELIYSLSPTRNISESLNVFGIGEDSQNLVVAIFDDEKGSKMVKLAKKINGQPIALDQVVQIANLHKIRKVYKVTDPDLVADSLSDLIITRVVTKDVTA